MEIDQDDIVKWKQKLLEILRFIIKICKDNRLRYFVAYGTTIGAIRHNGFIPWDDDIDIAMPRSDFERLKSIWTTLKCEKYDLLHYDLINTYHLAHAKIVDKNTTLIEVESQNYDSGLYVDIFPIDGCQADYKKFCKDIEEYRHLYFKLQAISEPFNFRVIYSWCRMLRKYNIHFLRILPYYLIRPFLKRNDIVLAMKEFENRIQYDDSEYVVSYGGAYRYREQLQRQWIGNLCKMNFENLEVQVPQDYNSYLSHYYGNYMQLPPIDRRVSHHFVSYYNLEKRIPLEEARKLIR